MSDDERTVSSRQELVELVRANTQGELSTTAHAVARARFIDAVTRRHRRASGGVIVGALGLSIGAAALVGALIVRAEPPSPSIACEPTSGTDPTALRPSVAEAVHTEPSVSPPPLLLVPGIEPTSAKDAGTPTAARIARQQRPRRAPDVLGDPWAQHRDAGARVSIDSPPWGSPERRTIPHVPAPQGSAPSRPPSLAALMNRYVLAQKVLIDTCWDRQVMATPELHGRVKMRITFHVERGRLEDVTASGAELPRLEACVADVLKHGSPAFPEDAHGVVSKDIAFQ